MKQKLILLFIFAVPLFCMAQRQLVIGYDYDAAGNRVLRKILNLTPRDTSQQVVAFPPDSTELQVTNGELQVTSDNFFVENIAQVEIKIYPNPTTEKITLEISNMEILQKGVFKLFTLNGQLLQEKPVYSAATEVSLAGYAKGVYILKVNVNDRTENWKVIKN